MEGLLRLAPPLMNVAAFRIVRNVCDLLCPRLKGMGRHLIMVEPPVPALEGVSIDVLIHVWSPFEKGVEA